MALITSGCGTGAGEEEPDSTMVAPLRLRVAELEQDLAALLMVEAKRRVP